MTEDRLAPPTFDPADAAALDTVALLEGGGATAAILQVDRRAIAILGLSLIHI